MSLLAATSKIEITPEQPELHQNACEVCSICGHLALTVAIVGGSLDTNGDDSISPEFVEMLREHGVRARRPKTFTLAESALAFS